MTHTWKLVSLLAVFSALLLATNVSMADPEKDKPLSEAEKLDRIMRQLADLTKKTEDARSLSEARVSGIEDQLRLLGERVNRLEESVRKHSQIVRESRFEPTPLNQQRTLGMGTIVLQNTWNGPATVTLNGKAQVLQPNEKVTLQNQPAGTYTYEVLANGFGLIRGPITRNLNTNETIMISVYPALTVP